VVEILLVVLAWAVSINRRALLGPEPRTPVTAKDSSPTRWIEKGERENPGKRAQDAV
jgi:hypothetical protein